MGQGKPVGTMFVELSLDATKYTKGQKEILAGAEKNSADINKTMKTVGITSDKMYDAMRQNIQNSLDAINRSHLTSAAERTRAEQSAAEKIKRINEQQFGHQTTMLEGLKKNWVAASVAIGAAMVAMNKAWNLADKAAQFDEVRDGLQGLSSQYNMTADAAIAMAKEAVGGQLSMMESGKLAAKAFALGFNPEQVKEFLAVSERLTDVMGGEIPDAFDAMERAAATGRKGGLVAIGINIDLAKTLEDYAKAHGIAKESIDSHLAMQIRANAIMEEAKKITDRLGEGTESTADKMNRMKATLADLQLLLGQGIVRAAAAALAGFQYLSAGVLGLTANIFNLAEGYARYRAWVYKVAGDKKQEAENTAFADKMLANGNAAWAARNDLIKQSANNWELATSSRKALARMSARDGGDDETGTANSANLQKAAVEDDKFVENLEKEALARFEEKIRQEMALDKEKYDAKLKYEEVMHSVYVESLSPEKQAIQKIMDAEKEKFDFIDLCVRSGVTTAEQAAKDKLEIEKNNAEKIREINEKTGLRIAKIEEARALKNLDYIQQGLSSSAEAFETLSGMYEKDSDEQKTLHNIAMGFHIAEKIAMLAELQVKAASAVLTQGSGDPYTAFARIAAMAAVVASILAAVGETFGGGSSASSTSAHYAKSTVLGAEDGTGSTSISNSLEILKDTYDIENTRLTQIYNEMRDLNNNITGLVTTILQAGGINNVTGSSFTQSQWLEEGGIGENISGLWGGNIFTLLAESSNKYIAAAGKMANAFKYFDPLAGSISLMGKLANSIFGGSTTVKLKESGIAFGDVLISEILSGMDVNARQYAKYKITEDGGWLGSDSTSTKYKYSDLDDSVTRMITLVYNNISSGLIYMAQELGGDVADVYAYVFEAEKLNLKKMSTDEMNTALSEYFSKIADVAVESLFGDLISQYQELNEGLYETAIRLISDKATIEKILELTNKTFSGTTSQFIKFSESLITVAGSLDDLTDAFSTYYDAFFTDAEKQADYKKSLQDVLGAYGYSLPTERSGYRNIVESIDLTTEAGLKAYYAMLAVSETADKYYSYLEDASSSIDPENYSTNIEYQRALAGLPKYADGGYTSGGYAIVGETGPEIVNFSSPARVVSNKDSKTLLSNDELIAEVKALREDVQAGNAAIATTNAKVAKYTQFLERWDAEGLPT